jgi:acetolactate synthase-1/2/3 large subunit
MPEPLDAFVGVLGAASGGPRVLPDADLVILAGAEFDYRVGQLRPPVVREEARVIRIHADAARLRQGLEAHPSILGAPGTLLAQLAEACRRRGCPPAAAWLAEARQRRDAYRARCLRAAEGLRGVSGRDVVQAVFQALPEDGVLLVDAGNIGQWVHQLLDRYPGHWVTCGASGVVGWGLPGALAARALFPERPVVLLSGDGSFTFTVAELECAARQGLHFVSVVADDEQWGISVTGQVKRYGQPLYSLLGPTRLDRVAEGFGCRGVRVERQEELAPPIREALTLSVPSVLHVPIVPGSPAD